MIEWIAIVVSIISLVISILAFRQNSRKIKADKLDKYGTVLGKIQNRTSNDLNELSHIAWRAYEDSEKYMNKYLGYDSGILYRFCSGFCDQPIHAIGTNYPFIHWGLLGKIYDLEKNPEILKKCGEALSGYEALAAIHSGDWPEIFNTIFNFSENYRKFHSKIRNTLEAKSQEIDALIDRNKHEEIKLDESKIGKKLLAEKRKYKELLKLGLSHAEPFTANSSGSPFIETLCMLLTLYIVGKYDKWGNAEESA